MQVCLERGRVGRPHLATFGLAPDFHLSVFIRMLAIFSCVVVHGFCPLEPTALLAFKMGDCQDSFELVTKALQAYPEHTDSQELLKQLKRHFTHL